MTKTSLNIPPPTAVKIPASKMGKKFNPKILYAKVAPIMVNTPSPIASNFKNRFQCFFRREYKKKITIPDATVTITYVGSVIELGILPKITSLIVPPATPVIVASSKIPTKSNFFSIALNAPVIANATVPNRSNT